MLKQQNILSEQTAILVSYMKSYINQIYFTDIQEAAHANYLLVELAFIF